MSHYSEEVKDAFLFSLKDLDAALPVIEKYKDHLVAIGEVKIQYL